MMMLDSGLLFWGHPVLATDLGTYNHRQKARAILSRRTQALKQHYDEVFRGTGREGNKLSQTIACVADR